MELIPGNSALRDTYESLLMDYAFGALDQAQSLIVASHLALSPKARLLARACEDMAGTLLEKDCAPAPVSPQAFSRIMTAIDCAPCASASPCCHNKNKALPRELNLPEPLENSLQGCADFHWTTLSRGFQGYDIALDNGCASKARFMKIDPGLQTQGPRKTGLEITLVLNGAFMESGHIYRRGDLLLADETLSQTQQACPKAGCVCLVVSSASIKPKGFLSFLNPFLKS